MVDCSSAFPFNGRPVTLYWSLVYQNSASIRVTMLNEAVRLAQVWHDFKTEVPFVMGSPMYRKWLPRYVVLTLPTKKGHGDPIQGKTYLWTLGATGAHLRFWISDDLKPGDEFFRKPSLAFNGASSQLIKLRVNKSKNAKACSVSRLFNVCLQISLPNLTLRTQKARRFGELSVI